MNIIRSLIIIAAGVSLASGVSVAAAAPPIATNAESSALIDVKSGRLLHSKNGDKPLPIASLTKIMTAVVAIEHGQLSDKVTVSKQASGKEGSSVYLKPGEEMSLHHLLYGLMLRSGNDAATAIAEHVGGSEEGFVFLMNEKAQQLGLTNTQFQNPHGLDAKGHYSTANDVAVLTAYALKNPVFQDIVKTKVKRVPNPHESWDYTWHNKNKMLSLYDGADGVKTGYTKTANRCLVSSATRGGMQLAAVTLSDSDDWADHRRLLDYGFNHFAHMELARKGEPAAEQTAVAALAFSYPVTEEEKQWISRKITLADRNTLAYRLGERGKLEFYLKEQLIGAVPLVEADSSRLNRYDDSAFRVEQAGEDNMRSTFRDVLRTVLYRVFAGGFNR